MPSSGMLRNPNFYPWCINFALKKAYQEWLRSCHYRQLPPSPGKCQLSFHYLVRLHVGRKISDGGVINVNYFWPEGLPFSLDILWTWIIGSVINLGLRRYESDRPYLYSRYSIPSQPGPGGWSRYFRQRIR